VTSRRQPRILVVDDERLCLQGMEDFLARYRLEVRSAENSAAALDVLREWEPDVLLLDIMMPEVDGITLLRRLRADIRWIGLHVIVASARAGTEDRRKALEAGANAFLTKPFTASELKAALRMFVVLPGTAELQSSAAAAA